MCRNRGNKRCSLAFRWHGFSLRFFLDGCCVSQRGGKANTLQEALEAWVFPQAIHTRIYMKIDKPMGVFLERFLQAFDCRSFSPNPMWIPAKK